MMRGKGRAALSGAATLLINPHFLLCFGLSWLLTNGWAYLMAALGVLLGIGWMLAVSGAYLTFLWLPFTPEKLLTVALALVLLRRLFPEDEKTTCALRQICPPLAKRKKDAAKE